MKIRFALALLLWLSACSPHQVQKPDIPSSAQTEIPAFPVPNPSSTPTAVQEKMTHTVITDLSQRLSIKPEAVHVLLSESTLWQDSALGCPLPGKVYAQGTVSGYRFQLESGGQVYEYHTDETGTFVLCADEELPSFPVTPGEIDDGQPWMPVN